MEIDPPEQEYCIVAPETVIHCEGEPDRCLGVMAYTEAGFDDTEQGALMQLGWSMKDKKIFTSDQDVELFEVIIAENFVVKEYPFKIINSDRHHL